MAATGVGQQQAKLVARVMRKSNSGRIHNGQENAHVLAHGATRHRRLGAERQRSAQRFPCDASYSGSRYALAGMQSAVRRQGVANAPARGARSVWRKQ